ncbi:hypothetical protein MMC34_002526 [Xylographa carneopallida]|nr:hypothetical protein [Xylographa carneopallida]
MHIPFFRIFYNTTFSILFLVLVVLILVSPGDGIYQAQHSDRVGQALTIGGVYILSSLIILLIYSTRLYTTRTHLANIPRSWIPIKKGDLRRSVRHMIIKGLQRSAFIAYDAHPGDLRQDTPSPRECEPSSRPATANTQRPKAPTPIWGTISHPGWSSPSSLDLPNLHFLPIILELPNLIEAKAVSLAPPDPFNASLSNSGASLPIGPPLPDALVVELLQRPAMMGFRDYISHLSSLSLIQPSTLGPMFLTGYEYARFSEKALTESQFRQLMSIFAEILRGMKELDTTIIVNLHAEEESATDSDSEPESETSVEACSLNSTDTVEHTPFHTPMPYNGSFDGPQLRHEEFGGSLAGSEGTVRTAPSRFRRPRDPSRGTGSIQSRRQTLAARKMTSSSSVQKVRSNESSASSQRSGGSGGSVIRLAENAGPLDLPFVITTNVEDEEVSQRREQG